jgi:hypothetical protein
MKNLHKINSTYNEFQLAVLWWITVDNHVQGDRAQVVSPTLINRITSHGSYWDYQPHDIGGIVDSWRARGKPGYIREYVVE